MSDRFRVDVGHSEYRHRFMGCLVAVREIFSYGMKEPIPVGHGSSCCVCLFAWSVTFVGVQLA